MAIASFSSSPADSLSAEVDAGGFGAIEDLVPAELRPFVAGYLHGVDRAELASRGPVEIASAIRAHHGLAQTRLVGTANVVVRIPADDDWVGARAVVQVVTDDMPFLVDSAVLAIRRAGFDVEQLMHPVSHVDRDADGLLVNLGPAGTAAVSMGESFLHFELDAVPSVSQREVLHALLIAAFSDVRAAVADWEALRARTLELAGEVRNLTAQPLGWTVDPGEVAELLTWMEDGHFTLLGAIDHVVTGDSGSLVEVPGSALGILRAHTDGTPVDQIIVPSAAWNPLDVALITKTNSTSTIHRFGHYDIVVIKSYDHSATATPGSSGLPAFVPVGERRLVGMFTSDTYLKSPLDIPLLRTKVTTILERSGLAPTGHSGKELKSILVSHPRDELFATSVDDLERTAQGIATLAERKRVKAFLRRDSERGVWSCLVYLPRDRYNTEVRQRVQQRLEHVVGGTSSTYTTALTDSRLARILFTIPSLLSELEQSEVAGLDAALTEATRSWADQLADGLRAAPFLATTFVTTPSVSTPSVSTSTVEASTVATSSAEASSGETQTTTIAAPIENPEMAGTDFSQTSGDPGVSRIQSGLSVHSSRLLERYVEAFPAAYRAETPISQALDDVASVERTLSNNHLIARVHSNTDEDVETAQARLSLYSPDAALALADLLPVLANLGLRVIDEKASEVTVENRTVWIHDLGVSGSGIAGIDPQGDLARRLCAAIDAIWNGLVDNDGFNQLVTTAGLTHDEVAMLRLYARHARQLGLGFSLSYMETTLVEQHEIAALFAKLFAAKFDPDLALTMDERVAAIATSESSLAVLLDAIPSLDQDRILRCMASQIAASIRTNAYQIDRSALCVKIEPKRIPEAPEPRPRFEIFVSSPRVEGVHLRMGAVARGGLRWSDRQEDFRTEVLGLMKAQGVKNSVIVPAGAKGGFVVRQPPLGNDRAAIQAEGIACYQTFIRSLLDVTDNLVNGQVVSPPRVIRHDANDTYLVVAADKGTATFSDIANAISLERGFWLGDAFASGGSVGYDHKAMGITARGAWESVKRHFLRMGRNISAVGAAPFTVAGIGDMSGDVFGNGMLLSEKIQLVIAFDHRHIFIDPTPDPAVSFAERARLFALPRSSWDDYDKSLISTGGGVWPRTAKSMTLPPEALAVLGLGQLGLGALGLTANAPAPVTAGLPSSPDSSARSVRGSSNSRSSGDTSTATEASVVDATPVHMTPTEIIAAALRAPVDLLWNGGIGTYVKASTETHAQGGDRANDILRADANQLRCKIVGEGGNLGMTQRARNEFAQAGGWVNTDAIDNSAGVDTSDHEVNLKILVDRAVASGALPLADRNVLLGALTDEVAGLVLADNIAQNRVLGTGLAEAPGMVALHSRYLDALEAAGRLDRRLEALPDATELRARRVAGVGLTIPELAVLMAHTKLWITDQLLEESIGSDASFINHLHDYFPNAVVARLPAQVDEHPLRNEIIATMLANHVVNRNGSTFVFRLVDETHASVSDVVRAQLAASDLLSVDTYWNAICALDGTLADAHQNQLLLEADRAVERAARWLLRNRPLPLDHIAAGIAYRSAVVALGSVLDALSQSAGPEPLAGSDAETLSRRRALFESFGITPALARHAAHFEFVTSLLDIAELSTKSARPLDVVANIYLTLDDQLRIGEIRRRILALPRDDRWDSLARASMRDDLAAEHLTLTSAVLQTPPTGTPRDPRSTPAGSDASPTDPTTTWITTHAPAITRHLALVTETAQTTTNPLASLSVVLRQLRSLA
jgi:glutamate dehydrogenase